MFKKFVSKISSGNNKHLLLLFIVLVFAAIPRLWNLEKDPPLIVDEPANIRDIDLVLKNGLGLTSFHWDFSKSQVVHIPVVLLIKLGMSDKFLALRYTSILISLFSLIPFFFIAKYFSNIF